jgi:hypothetical protein
MKPKIGTIIVKVPLIVIGIITACLVATLVITDRSPSTLPRRTWRMLSEIAGLLAPPRRPAPLPPLVNVPVVPVDGAGSVIRDESYVVGVELEGESRAYPINMLSRPDHHVVDDILGGKPIAVTWCGLCQSALVYSRQVDGKTLTLFVSGELNGENMVMRDIETQSDWPQMTGEAVTGPLTGRSLVQIPSVWTDWKSWRTQRPDTTVMNISQTVDYYRHDAGPSSSSIDQRYFASLQWGLVRDGKALSWPLRELAKESAVNDTFAGLPLVIVFESRTATITAFDRRLDDQVLTFRWGPEGLVDDQTTSVWGPVTGRCARGKYAGRRLSPVAGTISHLRAWRTYHPDTVVRAGRPG